MKQISDTLPFLTPQIIFSIISIMTLANRLKSRIPTSATLALNTRVNRMIKEGQQVYHLGFGEARFPVHPKILSAFREHATARSYLPVDGLTELRENIADFYSRKFRIEANADQIITGTGSKSLLYAAIKAIEGDMILPSPSWVSYHVQANLCNKAVSWIPTGLENNYCLTAEELKVGLNSARNAGQSPAILVLNSPHNPSGIMYPPSLLAALADVARKEKLIVISDEIYALTAYGEIPHVSMAHYYQEGTVVTGGLSKHLSLGGWRFGLAILPPGELGIEMNRYISAVASNVWTTVASPVQYAAIVAYSSDPDIDAYVDTCTAIHGHVTRYLYKIMQSLNIPCSNPSGGFYLYPSFAPWRETLLKKYKVRTDRELAQFLLDEEHIASLPGSDFGADPLDLSLRLSTSYLYALTDEDGEAMLKTYKKNLPVDQFLKETCPKLFGVSEQLNDLMVSLN